MKEETYRPGCCLNVYPFKYYTFVLLLQLSFAFIVIIDFKQEFKLHLFSMDYFFAALLDVATVAVLKFNCFWLLNFDLCIDDSSNGSH